MSKRMNDKQRKFLEKNTAVGGIEPYEVEVKYNNVDKAYKILQRMLKKDRVLEEYKERQTYRKPSEVKHERNKRWKKKVEKMNKERQAAELADSER